MKLYIFSLLFVGLAVLYVEGDHMFVGTNVQRNLAINSKIKYASKRSQERVEFFNYTLPSFSNINGRYIQGILAYDLRNSSAIANVTAGGIGTNFVKIRMRSAKGQPLNYNIYIYR